MQQIQLFLDGEHHYGKIYGDTGPLVYPALHVYLYSALYYFTDHGTNIFKAQCIFALLYLITISFVISCYRRVGAPPWLLVPLVLSKRLHSIFLLRLFNDCWVTFFLWFSIWALQKKMWPLGAVSWAVGLGIKMTMLLAAPALTTILIQAIGIGEAFFMGAFTLVIHGTTAFPFLNNQIGTGFIYFERAFDFGRQFLYKWTVNWRFVDEKTFLSREFAIGLLVVHVSIILYFMQHRWVKPSSSSIRDFVKKYINSEMSYAQEQAAEAAVTPTFVMDTMLGSVAIGLLCARSLHYQFYAYLGWASPYLLWRLGAGPAWVLAHMAVQEFAWLQYPSTNTSSAIVVIELAVQILCVLYGSGAKTAAEVEPAKAIKEKTK
jgi:alpha-1,3-mannosyltransferase